MTVKSEHLQLNWKAALTKNLYSILIFLFFAVRFFMFAQNRVLPFSSSVSVYYVLNYDLGFIPRAFIGAVISLFTDYLTRDVLNFIISIVTLSLLALVSKLLGTAIGKSDSAYRPTVILFVFLLITAPLSHQYLIERHFGRLDVFWLFITVISLVCLKKPFIRWAIPILCFAGVATHPGFMVTYMPALAIPLFYEIYRRKYSKSSIALFLSSCLVLISFFIYFQFFSPQVDFKNAEALGEFLSTRTDMKISNSVLYIEYFYPFLDSISKPNYFTEVEIPIAKTLAPELLVFLVFTLPLIVVFISVWKSSIHNADNKFLKLVFILCSLSPLIFILAALFAHDWERWWAAAINCQFIYIFYFILSGEITVKDSLRKIYFYFNKHPLILLCIFAFYGLLMLSDICSFSLGIFNKNIWLDFFAKVLPNFDYSL